jgi:hypothetical protein
VEVKHGTGQLALAELRKKKDPIGFSPIRLKPAKSFFFCSAKACSRDNQPPPPEGGGNLNSEHSKFHVVIETQPLGLETITRPPPEGGGNLNSCQLEAI